MIENKNIFYENSVVVGAIISNNSEAMVQEYLDELSFLAETAGGKVLKRFIQKIVKFRKDAKNKNNRQDRINFRHICSKS